MDDKSDPHKPKHPSEPDSGKRRGSGESEPRITKRAATDDDEAMMAEDDQQPCKIVKTNASQSHEKNTTTVLKEVPCSYASVTAKRSLLSKPSSSRRMTRLACADDDDDDEHDGTTEDIASASNTKRAKRAKGDDGDNVLHAKDLSGLCDPIVYESLLKDVVQCLKATKKTALPVLVCPFSGKHDCKSFKATSAAKFLTHLRTSHGDDGRTLLELFAADGAPLERCACQKLFPKFSITKHRKKCATQKSQTTMAAVPAAVDHPTPGAVAGPNNWVANVPWDQLDEDVLRAISQPGVPMYIGFKGTNCFKRLAKMLIQLHSCREGGATPARRWIATMALPCLMLYVPLGADLNANDRKQLQKKRLQLVQSGDWAILLDGLKEATLANREHLRSAADVEGNDGAIQAKIAQGKVAEAMDKPAKPVVLTADEVEEKLKPKHFPQLNPYNGAANVEYSNAQLPNIYDEDVRKALSDDKTRGSLGLTTCFWKQIYHHQPGLVLTLVQDITRNAVPSPVKAYLSSVNYTVLAYRDSGKLRAVGSVSALLKVAQNVLLKNPTFKTKIDDYLKTTPELAVGAAHGTTAGAMKVAAKLEKARKAQDGFDKLAVCALDLKGAFTHARRSVLRKQLADKLPAVLPLFDLMYGAPNKHRVLTRDDDVINLIQNDGVIQGSETSTLFFVMVTMAVLSDDLGHWKEVMTKYSDDMLLVTDIETVKQDFNKLKNGFANIGLDLSLEKCKLFMPGGTEVECQQHADELGVTAVKPDEGLTVLGVPVGQDDWVKAQLDAKATAFEERLDRMSEQVSTQSLLLVLQSAQSMFQHILAAAKPALVEDLAHRVDAACRSAFEAKLYGAKAHCLSKTAKDRLGQVLQFDDKDVTYRRLMEMRLEMPIKKGGLGVLSLVTRAKRAYLISVSNLRREHRAVWDDFVDSSLHDDYQALLAELDWSNKTVDSVASMDVSRACGLVYKAYGGLLRRVGDSAVQNAFLASRQRGAGTFVAMRPKDKQRTLTDEDMFFAIHQRLGILVEEVFGIVEGSTCGHCGSAMTLSHLTACQKFQHKRHDAVRDIMRNMVASTGVACLTEKQSDFSSERADLWTSNYTNPELRPEKSWLAGDVTIVSPVDQNGDFKVNAMDAAAKAKIAKYTNDDKADSFSKTMHAVVVPLAMSTFGAMQEDFHAFIAKTSILAVKTNRYIPGVDEYFIPKWKQIIATTLIRAQAAAFRSIVAAASVDPVFLGVGGADDIVE